MAMSIATRALKLQVAVGLCALLNFAGAFLSIKVALTISSGIVDAGVLDLRTIFAALVGDLLEPARLGGRAALLIQPRVERRPRRVRGSLPAGPTRSRAPTWWRR
jgi:hypothetical protein